MCKFSISDNIATEQVTQTESNKLFVESLLFEK